MSIPSLTIFTFLFLSTPQLLLLTHHLSLSLSHRIWRNVSRINFSSGYWLMNNSNLSKRETRRKSYKHYDIVWETWGRVFELETFNKYSWGMRAYLIFPAAAAAVKRGLYIFILAKIHMNTFYSPRKKRKIPERKFK
jgi:hypothetical protein